MDELSRISPESRLAIVDVVNKLHGLGLPHLAGIVYPITHPEWPSDEPSALTCLETLSILLGAKPHVLAQINPLLAHAVKSLSAIRHNQEAA